MPDGSRRHRRQQRARRTRRRSGAALGATALVVLAAILVRGPGLVLPAEAADPGHYRASAEESLADVQSYWSTALPAAYRTRYTPIPTSRVFAYSSTQPPPACGGRGTTPYREVAGNAFYCEPGDFIAYDVEQLIPTLRRKYGDVAVGLVLAHGMGHAVQARVGAPDGAFVYLELQADCFAGAWAGRVASGRDTDLRLSTDDLDRALAGFLDLRDPSGTEGGEDGAHGNAFDRASAFQDGFLGGARVCRAYETDPPDVTQAGFRSSADRAVNGDPPLAESLPLLRANLDAYWSGALRRYDGAPTLVPVRGSAVACAGESDRGVRSDRGVLSDRVVYCGADDTIVYATATLQQASDEIGDMGAGVFLAAAWASAVQDDLGLELGSAAARARSDCLTGAWAGAVHRGTATTTRSASLAFSPGDLDEVVAAFVAMDGAEASVDRGTVFGRLRDFRRGFTGGPAGCLPV
ncbi:MAG: neutral zinc metallopeptidase [Actinomycetota bacterium]